MASWFLVGCREVSGFPTVYCFRRAFDSVGSAPEKVADRCVGIQWASGDASAGAAFDLGKLESYTEAQLKQLCKDLACPIKRSTRKEELQKALRAWVASKEAEGHTEDEDEGEEEEVQSIHNGTVGGPVLSGGGSPGQVAVSHLMV
ncbi:hypothetical protein NDU88_003154 [Pleurodeles waltl]|uniref:SAP domain-containing protein n=1 Tax=Pleurodeles waltl TaxID=8319 RepID=A0AAV7LHQ4_PLEWA|nr:hypothetical protein NDU88_003154 [Pleurodeles waltl]